MFVIYINLYIFVFPCVRCFVFLIVRHICCGRILNGAKKRCTHRKYTLFILVLLKYP